MKKELLIITNYFPPEIGAASNRIFQLSKGLNSSCFKVTVLTPLPNYPKGKIFDEYKGEFIHKSEVQGINVHRLWLYASNSSNKFKRLFAMLSYSISLIWYFLRHQIPNTVIIQSPPLLVAFTSILFLRSKRRKVILNVSDLWPVAGLELGAFKRGFNYSLLEKIEHFNYKSANLILGQSQEILEHVHKLFPNKSTFLYRNYPIFQIPNYTNKNDRSINLRMVYAGLLGLAQGIDKLCENLNYDGIEFHIYGSGAEADRISLFIKQHPELPIYFHGQLDRKTLHKELMQYDLAIIPLLNRIYGSVPSKIFEYARLGLPMLYFGGGEGESLISEYHLGWIARSGDYDDLNNVLQTIKLQDVGIQNRIQKEALNHFDFKEQLNQLISRI